MIQLLHINLRSHTVNEISSSLDLISSHYTQSTVEISLKCRFRDEQSLPKELTPLIKL